MTQSESLALALVRLLADTEAAALGAPAPGLSSSVNDALAAAIPIWRNIGRPSRDAIRAIEGSWTRCCGVHPTLVVRAIGTIGAVLLAADAAAEAAPATPRDVDDSATEALR